MGVVDFERDVKPLLTAHCAKCHNADKPRGGVRLDHRAAVIEGGNTGLIVTVGKSADSRLIAVVAGQDDDVNMPPAGPPLTAAQVGILRAWIDQGLKMPATKTDGRTQSDHWAFQPVVRPAVPADARHPVDAFVLAQLKAEGVAPSPPADKPTLLRRVSVDLTGLPPSPGELDAFLSDDSPDAYETVVDRLLQSPHYGEKWGRHWLDAARYADSDGYEKDSARPFAWRFRDWVIHALNVDKPFDEFTVEQLAGDLLPDATIDQKIATGFHRQTLTNREGGVDQEEFRVAAVVDRVATTGTVWLGLTVGCAQCHDHKFDPISHREFYRLFAFFNRDREADIAAPLPNESAKAEAHRAAWEAKRKQLSAAVDSAKAENLPKNELANRGKTLAAHLKRAPKVPQAMTLSLGPAKPTHVMIRGDFLRPGVTVTPGTPAVLPAAGLAEDGTRLDLAKWLVGSDNPLTSRVLVNWVWQKYFGRGIVPTLNDFGTQGEPPSHPKLLDWLAAEFRDPAGMNWSLKELHRLIVTSATYRQSSAARPELADRDPLNAMLARQARLRLPAELVRDSALAVSGLLTRTVGGPSVRPPQPDGVSALTYANAAKWVESTGPDRYRRGLYIWFQRTSPYPMLMMFDSPDANVCVVRRERSNTPLQALTLLNDTVFVEAAQALAGRVVAVDESERVDLAVRLCLARHPTPAERDRLLELFAEMRALAAADPTGAKKLAGPTADGVSPVDAAAWVAVCRTIMNLDEFVTRE